MVQLQYKDQALILIFKSATFYYLQYSTQKFRLELKNTIIQDVPINMGIQ